MPVNNVRAIKLKAWPEFFQSLVDGRPFDNRRIDGHKFSVGDIIEYHEWDDRKGVETGRTLLRTITHILPGATPGVIPPLEGVKGGYCILGFGIPLMADGRGL